ncbi:MAG TPA: energy-coupling factor transporter transmembrane component T [Gemmatimonadales bacterium]|nr:energy-coupling factor transporter transmembrane component T [Gemmatimonadales bacterium]
MSQPAAPRGLVARAHPFTPLVACLSVVALVFLLPAPGGPLAVALLLALGAPLLGDPRALVPAAWLALPFWAFLFFLHGVIGDPPMMTVGPMTLSRHGLDIAITTSARLTAVILASVLLVRGFRPGRFVDAALAAGWPWTGAYLAAATLNAIPRFQQRAVRVREAMRARGLRVRGSMLTRARAFVPLALPLMLGALHDVDERAFALATRQVRLGDTQRTPLRTPDDPALDRLIRWGSAALVLAAALWRILQ